MAEKIIMPQGGQDIKEGRVVRWKKAEGDPVKKGEVVCEVETEKAVFEVESPADGVLLKIVVPAGKIAPTFSTIGVVGAPGEKIDPDFLEAGEAEKEETESTGVDVAALRKKVAAKAAGKKVQAKVSGRARKLADEKGIDISLVEGTGPKGRITEKDVLAHLEKGGVPSAAPAAAGVPESAPRPAGGADLRGQTVPMSRMRKVIARRLQQSKQTIPHFYVTVAVDMTDAIALRKKINAKAGDADLKISINDMIVKACSMALAEFPQVNCKVEEEAIVYLQDINIGVAVSVEEGLLVPVLPEVDTLSLRGIAKKTKELAQLAKAGKQASFTPGTFTVSNMGMMDVDEFIAIINPPETAILAVAATRKKLVVSDDDSLRIRQIMKMTLSADHRAVDGALASTFINKVKYCLENAQVLLG